MMENELIERARKLPEDPTLSGKIARAMLPALCDALEAAQAEVVRMTELAFSECSRADAAEAENVRLTKELGQVKCDLENARDERNRELGNNALMALSNANAEAVRLLTAENAKLRAERDAADYLLAEGYAHSPEDFE